MGLHVRNLNRGSMSELIQIQGHEVEANVWATLKDSIYPGAKDNSIIMAISYCKAAGLDPLLKPVHIVPMSVKNSSTNRNEFKDVIMPGIGLYRIQAARSNQYAGVSEPEFGQEITENLDGVSITYPEWCKVTVKKVVCGVIVEFTAKEYWKENYAVAGKDENGKKLISPNTMWQKRPFAQIAKCSEAQALRKAFPEFISQQPTAEEMEGKSLNEFEPRDITPSAQKKLELQEQAAGLKEELSQALLAKSMSKQLMVLCRDNELDLKAFTDFAGVSSDNIKSVEQAIDNFESLKADFLKSLEIHNVAA